jgi:hypothetical protein
LATPLPQEATKSLDLPAYASPEAFSHVSGKLAQLDLPVVVGVAVDQRIERRVREYAVTNLFLHGKLDCAFALAEGKSRGTRQTRNTVDLLGCCRTSPATHPLNRRIVCQ